MSSLKGYTVLVVDDEELMRNVTAMMLEEYEAKVLTAADGAQGEALFAEYREQIDLVFLDFSMPRMNGYEAFLAMEKLCGKKKVGYLMVSGLKVIPEIEKLLRQPNVAFLAKPFQESALLEQLLSLIDATQKDIALPKVDQNTQV